MKWGNWVQVIKTCKGINREKLRLEAEQAALLQMCLL